MASIFTSQTPANANANDSHPYTLGTLFRSDVSGQITGIRWFFPTSLPTQTVIGVLYSFTNDTTGSELARANFVSPVAATWNTCTFSAPVVISANTKYVAAVWTKDFYVSSSGLFVSAITNGHLTGLADDAVTPAHNGRFDVPGSTTDAIFPASTFGSNGYFVDVVFTTDPTSSDSFTFTESARLDLAASDSFTLADVAAMSGTRTLSGVESAVLSEVSTNPSARQTGPFTTSRTLTYYINRAANTLVGGAPKYTAVDAANRWAGTVGLTLLAALNIKAGNNEASGWRALGAVCNQLAGTAGLSAVDALSRM